MLQTTNNVFNKELYNFVKPESLFAWQRVRVANMMANGGEEWSKVIAKYNSGITKNTSKSLLLVCDYLFSALISIFSTSTLFPHFRSLLQTMDNTYCI